MSKTKSGVPWKGLRQKEVLSRNLENPEYTFSMKIIMTDA